MAMGGGGRGGNNGAPTSYDFKLLGDTLRELSRKMTPEQLISIAAKLIY